MPTKPMEEMEDLDATGLVTFRPQHTSPDGDGTPERPPTLRPDPWVALPTEEMEDLVATGLVTFQPQPPPSGTNSPSKSQSNTGRDKTDKKKKPQKPASSKQSLSGFPEDIEWDPDISALGQVTFIRTEAKRTRDISEDGQLQPDTLPEPLMSTPHENSRLTSGQAEHVDHLLTVETDSLAREVLITIKREGMPPKNQWRDFLEQYALSGWDAESDAIAWATLAMIANSDWDKQLEALNRQPIGVVHVSGTLTIYTDEELSKAASSFTDFDPSVLISVYEFSKRKDGAALIDMGFGRKYWVDTNDSDGDFDIVLFEESGTLEPQPIGVVHVSGTLTIYTDEELGKAVSSFTDVDPSVLISVYEFSKRKDGAALIDMGFGRKYWVDTNDSDADFDLHLFEDAAASDDPSGYEILPIVPDEIAYGGESDIEVSDEEWADRTGRDDDLTTKRGVLSRDYNHVPDEDNPDKIHESFRLQSPVVGQDVRVEFVVRDHETLGNYVVISFSARYYQSNDEVMRRLEMQRLAAQRLRTERPDMERFANLADHNPDRWHEDGRIFYAFAHLSKIYVNAGEILDSRDKAIIGLTGKSGTGAHHLDLAVLYFGSSQPGGKSMEGALSAVRWNPGNANLFFGLAMRSQLDQNTAKPILYGENLDSARLHPELDESSIAEFMRDYSIYVGE